jgi:UDP-N-acetylmuramate dehydrogenase
LREQLPTGGPRDAAQVERAVRAIRQSKLPDPVQWPNAGSFFKNPVIAMAQFAALQKNYPDMPHFPLRNKDAARDGGGPALAAVKIPAAWLIDRCGWKGRRCGSVGVHSQQALVLIHYGGGNAETLLALALQIRRDVSKRFGVELELEPGVYGNDPDLLR